MSLATTNKKEAVNFKEQGGGIWEGLEGGKGRERLHNYINLKIKKLKDSHQYPSAHLISLGRETLGQCPYISVQAPAQERKPGTDLLAS